jgi:hypothetical protein
MGNTSEQIVKHLEEQRRELRDNMIEFEQKVTRAVSWRSHVEQRPMMMMGLAFGGGVLLSALLGGTSRPRTRNSWPAHLPAMPEDSNARSTPRESAVSETWENLKGALLGLALAKAGTAVENLLPGFREEYRKAQAGHNPR